MGETPVWCSSLFNSRETRTDVSSRFWMMPYLTPSTSFSSSMATTSSCPSPEVFPMEAIILELLISTAAIYLSLIVLRCSLILTAESRSGLISWLILSVILSCGCQFRKGGFLKGNVIAIISTMVSLNLDSSGCHDLPFEFHRDSIVFFPSFMWHHLAIDSQ